MSCRPAVPASCRDLEVGRAARALISADGSFTAAARKLEVPTTDLRTFLRASPALAAAAGEGLDRLIDKTRQVFLDGLENPDKAVRLKAAAAVLRTFPAARRRGFG